MAEEAQVTTNAQTTEAPLISPVEKKTRAKKQAVNSPETDQLVGLIQHLAISVETLTNGMVDLRKEVEVMKGKGTVPVREESHGPMNIGVMSAGTTSAAPTDEEFFSQVPVNLLAVAKKSLGEKFKFKCVASHDSPHFTFTVIVPPEYSPLPVGQVDQRSKVIANSAGANGVKEWCDIVKANVIKFLGGKLPVEGGPSL